MFRENTFDSRNICQPQTEAFWAILQDQYLLGAPWWAAELWVRGMAPRLHCTAGHVAAFVAPERIGLRGFYMPGVTGCCRVTSGTTELQTGQHWEESTPIVRYGCCICFQKMGKAMLWASENKLRSEFSFYRKGKTFVVFVPFWNKNCLERSGFPTERKCQVLTHISLKLLY